MKTSEITKDKIFLENLIFYRASLVGIPLYSVKGMIKIDTLQRDLLLRELLTLYNGVFLEENWQFIRQEELFFQTMQVSGYHQFSDERRRKCLPKQLLFPMDKKPAL